ncbi:MAG TPA: dienelactone hydrolase family protein [Phycisphaerae bacterium]|jgi:pimeloyl-ACP methyl ester carboxylesterase|nr:dienelactone hydrolase family protein [Phycisphaerae bacterium]HRT41856.1 dienelactone hydrolase family protein [Phycisphaerae bacterium]
MTTAVYDDITVEVPAGRRQLEASLTVPPDAKGIVLFAHGSGSSRHSPRNRFVAQHLNNERLATLLLDLLTPAEEEVDARTAHLRFNIDLLAERLGQASDWVHANADLRELPIGYFGASTGAAAALVAAADRPNMVRAIVSRGGRPDLALPVLGRVTAPVLLIVGENDAPVIRLNRMALQEMLCYRELEIVPRATHLFEEPGALEQVARLAAQWFGRFLAQAGA